MTTTTQLDLSLTPILSRNGHNFRCKHEHCHGNLAKDIDDDTRTPFLFCVQCNREHDMNGNLIPKFLGQRR